MHYSRIRGKLPCLLFCYFILLWYINWAQELLGINKMSSRPKGDEGDETIFINKERKQKLIVFYALKM